MLPIIPAIFFYSLGCFVRSLCMFHGLVEYGLNVSGFVPQMRQLGDISSLYGAA